MTKELPKRLVATYTHSSTNTPTLLPCPFCGSPAFAETPNDITCSKYTTDDYGKNCPGNLVMTSPELWNTRTSSTAGVPAQQLATETDGSAIVVAILTLCGLDENFHLAWNHSTKLWRFTAQWLDIELSNKSLRPLVEEAVDAVLKAQPSSRGIAGDGEQAEQGED